MVHSQELLGGATKGLEADEDPEFLCSPEGDVIDMGGPTEVAGDDDTKQARLVNDFKGLTFGEMKLGQEVELFSFFPTFSYIFLFFSHSTFEH